MSGNANSNNDAIVTQLAQRFQQLRLATTTTSTTPRQQPPRPMAKPRNANEQSMMARLMDSATHVLKYEEATLQEKARAVVPIDRLHSEAREILSQYASTCDFQDCLMRRLLKWYKNEFFKWVNEPDCDFCSAKTRGVGMAQATPEEARYGAGRVELYMCTSCGRQTRFPRYNDPGKLLESRRGRCGEWANCFTLICRALGYEARYVLDFTDHVWTEVYSDKKKRWVHTDPCEETYDSALMYESGWGKKLSYVFAFNANQVVDVIHRYSRQYYSSVLTRRNMVPEDWLNQVTRSLSLQRQANLPETVKRELEAKWLEERIELFVSSCSSSPSGTGGFLGRQSGSLEWRLSRGETGSSSSTVSNCPPSSTSTNESSLLGCSKEFLTTLFDLSQHAPTLKLNGSARQLKTTHPTNPAIKPKLSIGITPCKSDQTGSVFTTTIDSKEAFDGTLVIEFGFRVCDEKGQSAAGRADGFAMVIQSDRPEALGGGGGGLGYEGLRKAIALEFDTYVNSDKSDPQAPHISLQTPTTTTSTLSPTHTPTTSTTIPSTSLPNIQNGNIYFTKCFLTRSSDPTRVVFEVCLTDSFTTSETGEWFGKDYISLLQTEINMSAVLSPNPSKIFIGFTGACGGLCQRQEIFDFRVMKIKK